MINLFVQIIKLEKMNISAQPLVNQLLAGFAVSASNRCPACGRMRLKDLRIYERCVTEWRHGKIVDTWIKSRQFKCECGRYHIFLPSVIVPYRHHSLPLIIHALYDYYTHALTVTGVCRKYHISIPTLYRWKKQFEKDKKLWLTGLKNIETSPAAFLSSILSDLDMIRLGREFRQSVYPHRMFMQSHKNAFLHRYV